MAEDDWDDIPDFADEHPIPEDEGIFTDSNSDSDSGFPDE
jgi:hypothetical protein